MKLEPALCRRRRLVSFTPVWTPATRQYSYESHTISYNFSSISCAMAASFCPSSSHCIAAPRLSAKRGVPHASPAGATCFGRIGLGQTRSAALSGPSSPLAPRARGLVLALAAEVEAGTDAELVASADEIRYILAKLRDDREMTLTEVRGAPGVSLRRPEMGEREFAALRMALASGADSFGWMVAQLRDAPAAAREPCGFPTGIFFFFFFSLRRLPL